jgi:ubiquinone biosynthesis protein UbiJ
VAEFLSAEWLVELNETLSAAGPVPLPDGASLYRVVLEFLDAPVSRAHAVTFTMDEAGASLREGDDPHADASVRLNYADALALTQGRFDSASALREGRVKVRGDINAIVPMLGWLQLAHPRAPQNS